MTTKAAIEKITQEILTSLGVMAEVKISETEAGFEVEISSKDNGLLIGFNGENLIALQHLLRVIIAQKIAEPTMIMVDIGGWRAEQKAKIEAVAEKTAETVLKNGQPKEMEPMSSYERRIVHTVLAKKEGVRTESTGFDRERRVVIKKVKSEK